MFSQNQLQKILIKSEVATKEEFKKYALEAEKKGRNLERHLIESKIISPLALYENAATIYKLPFIDLKNQTIRKDVLFQIPEPIATSHNLIPFDSTDKEIKIAVTDPDDIEIFEFIKKKTGLEPILHLSTPESIKDALRQYHKSLKAEFNYLSQDKKG